MWKFYGIQISVSISVTGTEAGTFIYVLSGAAF